MFDMWLRRILHGTAYGKVDILGHFNNRTSADSTSDFQKRSLCMICGRECHLFLEVMLSWTVWLLPFRSGQTYEDANDDDCYAPGGTNTAVRKPTAVECSMLCCTDQQQVFYVAFIDIYLSMLCTSPYLQSWWNNQQRGTAVLKEQIAMRVVKQAHITRGMWVQWLGKSEYIRVKQRSLRGWEVVSDFSVIPLAGGYIQGCSWWGSGAAASDCEVHGAPKREAKWIF